MKADLTRTARNQDGQQVTVCVRLCQTGTEREGVVIDLTRSGFTQSEDARPNTYNLFGWLGVSWIEIIQ